MSYDKLAAGFEHDEALRERLVVGQRYRLRWLANHQRTSTGLALDMTQDEAKLHTYEVRGGA